VSKEFLIPRSDPAVAPIKGAEIAILGGHDGKKFLGDVVTFNTFSNECKKLVSEGIVRFNAVGN